MMIENEYGALDSKLFQMLKDTNIPTLARMLTFAPGYIESARNDFVSNGKKVNPVFQYAFLDGQSVISAQERLTALRSKILHSAERKSIEVLYLKKLDELELHLKLLSAILENDIEKSDSYGRLIYGELDVNLANRVFYEVSSASGCFKEVVVNSAENTVPKKPSDSLQSLAFAKIQNYLPAIATTSHEKELSSGDLCHWWNESIPSYATGWTCEVNHRAVAIAVRNKSKKIIIPSELNYKAQNARQLFLHEVGIHVQRHEAGLQSPLLLLSLGLAGYQSFEEGLAIMAEQSAMQTFKYVGRDKYLSLALAAGAIDGKKRDFCDLYNLLEPYVLNRYKRRSHREVEQSAADYTWRLCCRTFRGGDPSIPGSVSYKGKIYLEGNYNLWRALQDDLSILDSVMHGKFDPLDTQQFSLLKEAMNR